MFELTVLGLTHATASSYPFCTSATTSCEPCYLGAGTKLVSFPYPATTTIAIDIIPHISQLPDGSNSTWLETLTTSAVALPTNASGFDTTIEGGEYITWKTQGVEL